MNFIESEEKNQLRRILAESSRLQTHSDRCEFLKFCGLGNYCKSMKKIEGSSDQFSMELYNLLSKKNVDHSEKLALVVFLEYLSEQDSNLSDPDKKLIEYIINKNPQPDDEDPEDESSSAEKLGDNPNKVSITVDNRSGGNYFYNSVNIKGNING